MVPKTELVINCGFKKKQRKKNKQKKTYSEWSNNVQPTDCKLFILYSML